MKELKFICAQPDDNYYLWQVHMWIESLRQLGWSDGAIVLVFIPGFRTLNPKWEKIVNLYPEAQWRFYKDDQNELTPLLGTYIPVLRPWCLEKYFTEHPEMKEKAVFYCDSDVIFSSNLKIDDLIDDDVCYLSDTNSYINVKYLDSKVRDVLPEKLEEYKKIDVVEEITSKIGISRAIAEANNDNSGGAQYLLKGIDGAFWGDVKRDCITIRRYLQSINKEYFANEDKGFQSWCSDMWAVLWNLWKREITTKNTKALDFCWASDRMERVEQTGIFHNAGITADKVGNRYCFYKGKYHKGQNPLSDREHIEAMLSDEESKKYATYHYLTKLVELGNTYNIDY